MLKWLIPVEKVKVKVTLLQALRLCTGRTAHRGSRGIALPFLTTSLEGVRGHHQAPAALYLAHSRSVTGLLYLYS